MAELRKSPWPGWVTVQLIGRGSFGAVYEIRRELVDGTVEAAAMKVITIPQNPEDISEMYGEGYDSESITASFRAHLKSIVAEYTLMQKLEDSANVVNCKDICYIQHDDGIGWDIFIRMELLTPLMKALPDSTAEETILKIGRDICSALVLCKKYGIIHRDIKPQNIFVSPNGGYKLGDFGIAKTVEKTMGGTKIGTYKYMAPEVYNNQPYGSGADIYSLGLVLYWLLNEHRMPFMPLPPAKILAGQDEQARQRRLTGERLPPPAHGSAMLKKIVLKACAYAPEDRFGSAEEMRLALQDCLRTPAAPQKQQQPLAPLAPIAEPTVIGTPIAEPTVMDTPTEFECETATQAVIPPQRPRVPQQPEVQAPPPEEKKAPAGKEKKKRKSGKLTWAALGVLLLCCGLLTAWQFTYGAQAAKYRDAQQLMDGGEYSAAAEAFEALEDYKDSAEKAEEARGLLDLQQKEQAYQAAQTLMDNTSYQEAAEAFEALGSYNNSAEKAKEARNQLSLLESYQSAQALLDQEDYQAAAEAFDALGDYNDSVEKAKEARGLLDSQQKEQAYQAAQSLMDKASYQEAAKAFETLGSYNDSAEKAQEARRLQGLEADYQSAQSLMDNGKYMQAMWAFSDLDYRDSAAKAQEAKEDYLSAQRATLAAGSTHTVGIQNGGTVVATGNNASSQCDVSGWWNIISVAVGDSHTVGLRADGTVVAKGSNNFGQCSVSGWKDIVAIAAGNTHTVGLRADGTVVAVGSDTYGKCNVGGWKDIVAIAAGDHHTVGLRADGTVVAVGMNGSGQCDVSGWRDIVAIAAGSSHTVGIRADGTVVAVGNNNFGQCIVTAIGWKDIVAIAAGDRHTVGLRANGTVAVAGDNNSGQRHVAVCTDIIAVAAGGFHTVGLRADGTVVATGNNVYGQCDVSGWKNIRIPG